MSIPVEILTMPGINMKTVATTTIGTTEDGLRRFIPFAFVMACTAESAISDGPTISVGTNSATYDNIIATFDTGGNLDNLNDVYAPFPGAILSVAPSTAIVLNVSVAATGTSGTMRCDILGYYI